MSWPGWTSTPGSTCTSAPTSSSWLNMVERCFREITTRRIGRGSFASVAQLVVAIEDYIAHHNDCPRPFIWTKTAGQIIAKVRRRRIALEAEHPRYLKVTALAVLAHPMMPRSLTAPRVGVQGG